jgi:hypothetical protein
VYKKFMALVAVIVALGGASLAVFVASASAHRPQDNTTTCPYNEYTEPTLYNEYCAYTQSSNGVTGGTVGQGQTILSGGAVAAGVTAKTTYPNSTTLVNVNLPAGTTADKFYLYTTLGVSFGVNHSPALLKKEILAYEGSKNISYTITKLSRPHGRIHLTLSSPVATPTFKINKNVFEFTYHERKVIQRLKLTKTKVSLQVTTMTGQVYTVTFRALFGALVVVKFH